MVAMCDKHLIPHLEYQYKNLLKLPAKLNPLGKVVLDQLAQLVDECLDEVVAVAVMVDLELCCTTELASHFHQVLSW
jgi:hypothetical protein